MLKLVGQATAERAVTNSPFAAGNKNLWTQIIEHNKAEAKKSGDSGRPDAAVFFVGSRGSGKTTLVNRFLYPDKTEVPKPTEGVEYTFARKQQANNIDKKDIAHIWEISGSEKLWEEVSNSDSLFLGMRQVTTAVVVIVLDLAKPSECLPTLEYWLDKVKTRSAATFSKLEKRGSKLPQQLRERSKKVFGSSHEDKEAIDHSGITVVVVAAKYDAFNNTDAELKKVMSRALRYVAHTNSAALFFLGGLRGSASQQDANYSDPAADKAQLNQFRAYLNHLIFTGADKKFPARLTLETDHLKPLLLTIGADKLSQIGRPRGADGGGGGNALAEWREVFDKFFPKEAKKARATAPDLEKYPEPEVDAVRKQRQAELAQFMKQQAALRAAPAASGAAAKLKAKTSSKPKA